MDKTEKELDQDELNALKSIGVIAANWYAVSYNANQMPYAIFESKEYAEAYRDKFSATSIVEPWPMIIKDLRKRKKTMTEKRTAEEISLAIVGPLPIPGKRKWASGLGKQDLIIKAMHEFAAQELDAYKARLKKRIRDWNSTSIEEVPPSYSWKDIFELIDTI